MAIRIVVKRNDFARLAAELGPRVELAVTTTALEVSAQAKQNAPVRTGNLRRSITTDHPSPHRARVGTDVEYAPYVEYGTSRMAAKPYLTPAVEGARAKFVARLKLLFGRR